MLASDDLRVKLPLIERINHVRMPVMREALDENDEDGKPSPARAGFHKIELLPLGYDAESKTFTTTSALDYAVDLDASEAAKWLRHLLEYFPWGNPGSGHRDPGRRR